ncbi:MAG: DUF4838 domain-containing protein [Clostridia bacterium]|jgi:hypothetical protein
MRFSGKAFAFALSSFVMLMCTLSGCTKTYDIPDAPEGIVYLVYEGKSNYKIVVGAKASKAEQYAAEELQKYIKKITGFNIPIIKDNKKETELEIVVGKTNREKDYEVDRDSLGEEGFTILWSNKKLVIAGGGDRGTIYGVYDFLESLGCRFFAEGVEKVPSNKTLELQLHEPKSDKPVFEYRDLFWTNTYDPVFSTKLRLNGCLKSGENGRTIPKNLGSGIFYAGPHFVHTFEHLVPASVYFDEHPEYFSEINGERTAKHLYSQLCLTNPDVLKICIDKVKEWLRENPEAKIVSVSQNDSFVIESYCTCSECKKVDREERSKSGTLIRFVNKIAEAIKDEFPDVYVDTLAYQYSIEPPRVTKPLDNVIVRVCTGGCSAHPIGNCPNNSGIKGCIERWAKISNRIYIWDYTTNFAQYLCPFPNLDTLQPNMQFFFENNVKGVFEQGNYQEGLNGEFGELRSYILAKLLWDPYTDVEIHINEFLETYYGKASPYVKEYVEFLHEKVSAPSVHFNLVVDAASLYRSLINNEELAHLDSLWEKAKEEAENERVLERVRRSELSYRFYKLTSRRGEFADVFEYDRLEKEFYKDCKELGVLRLSEGANIPLVNP